MYISHLCINTPNWKKLAQFYIDVFGFQAILPERDLHDSWLETVSGLKGAAVKGIHIELPGEESRGPTIEIFTHAISAQGNPAAYNAPGIGHFGIVADTREDVYSLYRRVLDHGGSSDGRIASRYYPELQKTCTMVYAKDPDGNIVEILNWASGNSAELTAQQEL